MATRTTDSLPASLQKARQRFEAWRKTRTRGDRIPERLWTLAVRTAGKHGPYKTALTLRLDYMGLKRRMARGGGRRGKFENRSEYQSLLKSTLSLAAELMASDATVYIRTDSREFTLNTTIDVVRQVFPRKRLSKRRRPFNSRTQTYLFGDKTAKQGEIDLVLVPR